MLLPEGLPLLPLDICPAGGVEELLVTRSVQASSFLSPRFIRGLGVQKLLSCGGLLLPALSQLAVPPHLCTPCEVMGREGLLGLTLFSVASPASSLHALRGDEPGGSSGGLLCSRLPLPPHLCTPCEVMRRESLRSSAPVRVPPRLPPRLPNLRLGKPGRCFEPALGRMALVTSLVAHAIAPLSVHG